MEESSEFIFDFESLGPSTCGGDALGLAIEVGQDWIHFLFLLLRKYIILSCVKRDFLMHVWIISLFCWIVVAFMGVKGILSLKACG